jgi:hypothetical protein
MAIVCVFHTLNQIIRCRRQCQFSEHKLEQQRQAGPEIIDQKDENGKAAGTKVIITIGEDI